MTFGDCAWVRPMEPVWKINIRITRQEMIRLRAAPARHSPNDQETASRSFVIPSSFIISISSFSLPPFHSDSGSGIRSRTASAGLDASNVARLLGKMKTFFRTLRSLLRFYLPGDGFEQNDLA